MPPRPPAKLSIYSANLQGFKVLVPHGPRVQSGRTKEDTQRYWSKVVEEGSEKRKAAAEDSVHRVADKKDHERDLARERKRRQRERKKAKAAEEGEEIPDRKNAHKALMNGANAAGSSSTIGDVADLEIAPASSSPKTHTKNLHANAGPHRIANQHNQKYAHDVHASIHPQWPERTHRLVLLPDIPNPDRAEQGVDERLVAP
ncbi:hypothetical protein B0H10DRAFT_2229079 [Mycena sp. CBHHK59/15]|nr:hypothetical protein B0H10DRAFT_2229079 [Mycena sp. CBHHK59/15]